MRNRRYTMRKGPLVILGNSASLDFSICLRNHCGFLLRRIAEICGDCVFPCKMTSKYCGDLRRRRICAKTAQTKVLILAREISQVVYSEDIVASCNTLTGFTPKGRMPSEILICAFTFPVLLNPMQKHHNKHTTNIYAEDNGIVRTFRNTYHIHYHIIYHN